MVEQQTSKPYLGYVIWSSHPAWRNFSLYDVEFLSTKLGLESSKLSAFKNN